MIEYDLIGHIGSDITTMNVSQMLNKANGQDVTFYIFSPGGDLGEGIAINGYIKKYTGKTKGVIIGHTASAGTVAILGCDSVECNKSAPFLIHNAIDPFGGNAVELRKKAENLDRNDKLMIQIYTEKTGLPESKVRELMAKEDWILPEEAKMYGFVDSVIDPTYKAVAFYTDKSHISNELLLKLDKKMGIFSKKDPPKAESQEVINILALKNGKSLIINAEVPAANVAVAAPVGMTLEDGSYELSDGRKIMVAGGVITEVMEKEMEPAAATADIVSAVTAVVAEEIAKVTAEFDAKLEALKKTGSTHTPPKGKSITAPSAEAKKTPQALIDEVQAGIRNGIVEARKK